MEVIHAATDADLVNNFYTSVYASAAASPTINGTTVSMVAGSTISITVKTISATANIYLIGGKKLIAPTVING